MKTHAPPIAERIPHLVQRVGASRNARQGGQVNQLRAMIERSPAMLAQRRACAAIQRERAESRPGPDTGKLARAERLLAMLQAEHSKVLLGKFAGGSVPDALAAAGSIGAAWRTYTGVLADAVREPAAALMQALDVAGAGSQAAHGEPLCDALAVLASRIEALCGLDDAAAIAAAAQEIRNDIDRLCQMAAALLARIRCQSGGDEPWQRARKVPGAMPPAAEPDTTAPPARETAPGEQQSG